MGIIKEMHGDIEQEAIHLLARYRDALMMEAISLTSGDIHAAEELVLQAFEVHLFNRKRYNSSKGGLLPWLKGIMRNMHGKAVRDKATRSIAYLSPEELEALSDIRAQSKSTNEEVESNSDAEIVRDAIARLPESARSVIVLHYFESLSIRQIAGMLCKSQDSVRSNLYYARKVLAKRLGKMLGRASLAVGALLVGSSLLYAAAVMTGLVSPLFTGTDPAPVDPAPVVSQANGDRPQVDGDKAEGGQTLQTIGGSPQADGDRHQKNQSESECLNEKTEENTMDATTNAVTWGSSVKAAAVKTLASVALAVTAVFGAAPAVQGAGEPTISLEGDTITVTVPEGTVATNASLYLCWGALDAGEAVPAWSHSACLADGTVTATGGVWTVSAAEKGVFAAMRAIVAVTRPYKAVEYVESTTGQAGGGGDGADSTTLSLDSGVRAKSGLHVKMRMMWLAYADMDLCGGRMASGSVDNNRIFPIHTYQKKWFLGYGGTSVNSTACDTNVVYEVEAKLYSGRQTLSVDGTQIYEMNDNSYVDAGGQCAVFGAYYAANTLNPISCAAHARCYYLKIWENGDTTDNPEGDLVRDFVPVKDPDGHGALYDKVTGLVFESVYFGTNTVEYLAVGAETGETMNLTIYRASAVANYYLPVVSVAGDTVVVTVPPGGVASPCGVILCWGYEAGGDTVDSWASSCVLTTNGLTSAGGTFSASAAALGITGGQCMRAFIVPGEAKRVEYVASDNTIRVGNNILRTVYIDTGVDARTGLRVETEMMWVNSGDCEFCGGRYTAGDNRRIFPVHIVNGKWFHGYGAVGTETEYAVTIGARYQVASRLYDGLQRLEVIDVDAGTTNTVNEQTTEGVVTTEGTCTLFAAWYGQGKFPGISARARCYYLKMWENGNTTDNPDGDLVRDFVPVKDYYGRGGVFDRVTGKVFHSGCYLNGLDTPAYINCGDETGESVVSLQPEVVVGSSVVADYMPETLGTSVAGGAIDVTVPPGAAVGETNVLVVCWGDRDYGIFANDWPNVLATQVAVGQEGGRFSFPAKVVEPRSAFRAFLVKSMGIADYISSTGNSAYNNITVYLDTGVKAKHGLRVQTRIEWLAKWSDFGFIGARPDSDDSRFLPIYGYQNGQWGLGWKSGNWNKGAFDLDTPYEVEAKMYSGEQRLTVDGMDKYAGSDTSWTPDYNVNVFAFAVNWYQPKQGSPNFGCRAKCYYLKMYTDGDPTTNPDGTLARDYVPAVLDGVAGMYDRQNKTFTASAGTGAFQYGAVTNVAGYVRTTLCASPSAEMIGSGFLFIVK